MNYELRFMIMTETAFVGTIDEQNLSFRLLKGNFGNIKFHAMERKPTPGGEDWIV